MELEFVVLDTGLDYHLDLFLRVKRAEARPATIQWYERVLSYYRAVCPGWQPDVGDLLTFLEWMQERGLSDYSKNGYWRALSGFINWVYKAGLITHNPLELVTGPPSPRALPLSPSEKDVDRLFGTIKQESRDNWHNVRDLALLGLALDTGARIGEIAGLTVECVDLIHQTITLPVAPKTNVGRVLVVGDDAANDLALWLAKRLFLRVPDSTPALFVSNYQQRGTYTGLTADGMRQRLAYWQRRAGIAHFRFNALRHAYAVYSLRNHADLLDIKAQLGHKSIKTTAIYTEVVNEGRRERHQKTSPRSHISQRSFDNLTVSR